MIFYYYFNTFIILLAIGGTLATVSYLFGKMREK